ESLSMLRGERWKECPFSQRHQAGRKLRARTVAADPFFWSSQSLLSCGLSTIESAKIVPPSRTRWFDAVVARPARIARVEARRHSGALDLPARRFVLGNELVELKEELRRLLINRHTVRLADGFVEGRLRVLERM